MGSATGWAVIVATAPSPLLTLAWDQGSGSGTTFLGFAVSSAGDVDGDGDDEVLAGSPEDLGYSVEEGAAALWAGAPTGLGTSPAWFGDADLIFTPCGQMWYGIELTTAGDVNGDGFSDVMVGSDNWAGLYLGSALGLSTNEAWEYGQGSCGSKYGSYTGYGWVIAPLGDVNGDGFDDVALGEQHGASQDGGAVYVHGGGSGGLHPASDWTHFHDEPFAYYGAALAGADVNGDGLGDMIVGAYGVGTVFAYHGTPAGIPVDPDWTNDVAAPEQYGSAVADAGDVNGDGYDDVLVSAAATDGSGGVVLVHHGSATGLETNAVVLDGDGQPGADFGYSVAGAGDIDGDGFDDVAIGAPSHDDTAQDQGAVFVYLGGPDGVGVDPVWSAAPTGQQDDLFGFAVAGAGDVDADGHADLVVGSPFHNGAGGVDEGRVYVFLGGDEGCLGDALSGDSDSDGVCALDMYGRVADCDDSDPATFPGAPELCDGLDNTCDGTLPAEESDEDGDGYRACSGDCDDQDVDVHLGATEVCDGKDTACAGTLALEEEDADADGLPTCAGDCDDTKAFAHPDVDEICGDGFDNDCDGEVEEHCDDEPSIDDGCGCASGGAGGSLHALVALAFGLLRRRAMGRRP